MRLIVLLVAVTWAANAQDYPTFEVAAVKVAAPDASPGIKVARTASANPTRFSRRNVTLASLLLEAYGLKPEQLTGPAWLNSEHYDIMANAPAGASAEDRLVMLQNLLTERFQLKLHRETRQAPVYEMVVARGGPKFQEAVTGPGALPAFRRGAVASKSKDGVSTASLREHGTMEGLAARLSGQVDRMIVDRTGLKGDYAIVLHWTLGAEAPNVDSAADPGVSIFAAMEAQLGLKIEPKRGSVEVLVVDRAAKVPIDN